METRSIIVLARIEQETIIVKEGRVDIGERHTFGTRDKAIAMVWVNDGGEEDLAKAGAYANTNGLQVFAYPTTEEYPLSRAKEAIMKGKSQ